MMFDGSAPTTSGQKFKMHKIALKSDVKKKRIGKYPS